MSLLLQIVDPINSNEVVNTWMDQAVENNFIGWALIAVSVFIIAQLVFTYIMFVANNKQHKLQREAFAKMQEQHRDDFRDRERLYIEAMKLVLDGLKESNEAMTKTGQLVVEKNEPIRRDILMHDQRVIDNFNEIGKILTRLESDAKRN